MHQGFVNYATWHVAALVENTYELYVARRTIKDAGELKRLCCSRNDIRAHVKPKQLKLVDWNEVFEHTKEEP